MKMHTFEYDEYQFKDEPSEGDDAEETRDATGGANRGEPQNGEARGATAVKGEKIN